MIYEDDNVTIRRVKVNGKFELMIDYYQAGQHMGTLVTNDLYDMDSITIEPFAR